MVMVIIKITWLNMKTKTLLGLSLLALSSSAFADNCQLDISVMDAMTYDKPNLEISLAKCDKVTLNLKHTGKMPKTAMGHNWVLTNTADQVAAAADGVQAGAENNFVKTGDNRIYAFTPIIGGGESTSVTFDTKALKAGGDYTYYCSFPGHSFLISSGLIPRILRRTNFCCICCHTCEGLSFIHKYDDDKLRVNFFNFG